MERFLIDEGRLFQTKGQCGGRCHLLSGNGDEERFRAGVANIWQARSSLQSCSLQSTELPVGHQKLEAHNA